MGSDGVFYEAVIVQNQNKVFTFDESDYAWKFIKFTGAQIYQGNMNYRIIEVNIMLSYSNLYFI
jgi:hypothetical protein